MNGISSWAIVICIAALCSSVMSMLSPIGEMKKIFRYILGVFILCAIILPIGDIEIDDFSLDNLSGNIKEAENIASDINSITTENLYDSVTELINTQVESFEISPVKTEIIMDIDKTNCISITKAIIYINRRDAKYKQKIISAIKNNLGISTEVYLTEER